MNKKYLVTLGLAVIIGVGGFFAGMKYQQSKNPRLSNFPQRAQGSRPVNGEILSVDDKSVTIKLADGGSRVVLLTDSTAINKSTTITKSDLKVGEKVVAFGTQNSDGSVTAQTVQLGMMYTNRAQ